MEFVLTAINHSVTPVALRFRSHSHLHQATVHDTARLARGRGAQRVVVQTLVARSLRFVMANKTVVIVGGWKLNKRHILEAAVDLGVRVLNYVYYSLRDLFL